MNAKVGWRSVGPAMVTTTYWRGKPGDDWIETHGGDGVVSFPEVEGAIGYSLYVEPGEPLYERSVGEGDYYWRITPIAKSKPLIHNGRKPR